MTVTSGNRRNPLQAGQSLLGLWGASGQPHAELGIECASAGASFSNMGTQGVRLTRLTVLPYGAAVCVGHSLLSVYLMVQEPPPVAGGGEELVGGGDLLVVGGGELLVVGGGRAACGWRG